MDQIVNRPQAEAPSGIEAALGLDRNGKKKRRRRSLWIAVAVVAAGAALVYWRFSTAGAPVPVSYQTVAAERGNLTVEVAATGTLQPVTQVDVSSELSGIIRTVEVRENERVATGQVLAELDTTRLTAQVERAQASVQAAEAQVADARTTLNETERTLERSQSLSERGMLAQQALETATAARDRARSALLTAQANLAVSRADLKLQEADLAKSTIYAPIDGIVLTRDVDPGQTVAASMSAPILFVIAENLERMQLDAAVDEADIGTVEIGQNASFTVDAFPGRDFDASIQDIAYAAVTTEGVVTYKATLTVDNADLSLRPGMTASVAIVTREANDAITIPSAAFRYSPPPPETRSEGGWSLERLFSPRMRGGGWRRTGQAQRPARDGTRTIYVLENGVPVARQVMPGASDGDRTEILSGLEEGATVIIGQREGGGRS
ncbi:MAG: efflux RND transporter periplasmic adaptor subunit [Rhizobiaceae bacterium]|nr:efflux RND transporter periplasmic adaptor subunit [Rhizobiaceae bacterium]MCV0406283.1 efflux RND transporter periplasmic adaptor subunit [Rhizobiaceae bacterium]